MKTITRVHTLTVKMDVTVPMLPNFVFTSAGKVGVEMLTDEALKQLGAAWTEALIRHAQERRAKGPAEGESHGR